jgi:hypothetical protein
MTRPWTSGTTQYPRTTVTIAAACAEGDSPVRRRLWWWPLVPWTGMSWFVVCVAMLLYSWRIAPQQDTLRLLNERLDLYAVMRTHDETRLRSVEEALWQVLQETRTPLQRPQGETPL